MSDVQSRQYGASPDSRLSTPPSDSVWWKVYPTKGSPFRFVKHFARTGFEALRKATRELHLSEQELSAVMFSDEQSELISFGEWVDLGGSQ